LPRPLSYDDVIGLWVNIHRAHDRNVMAHAQGAGISGTHGPIDFAFFDALAPTEEDAKELQFQSNAERQRQAVLARRGMING
jgi:hypothetical protein